MYQALQFPPYVPYTLPALADVPAPVAGDNGKAVTYRHAFGDFVYTSFEAAGAVAAHVALADPHSQYLFDSAVSDFGLTLIDDANAAAARTTLELGTMALETAANYLLASGTTVGASSQRQVFTNGITGPSWRPAADSTTALQMQNAAGTAVVTVNTTGGHVGINQTAPGPNAFWSPGVSLNITDTAVGLPNLRFRSTAVDFTFACDGSNAYFYVATNHGQRFYTNGIERMRILPGGFIALGGSHIPVTLVDIGASTTGSASLRLRSGVAPSAPNEGDMWSDGADFYGRGAASYSFGAVVRTTAIRPLADSTTALQMQNAAGTAIVTVNTITGAFGLGTTNPLYKFHMAGAAINTIFYGLNSASAADGDVINYATVNAITGSLSGFDYTAPLTGNFTQRFRNTNSTSAAADLKFEISVNGANAGDPRFVYTISGVRNWVHGVDNSDGDKFKISGSDTLGSSDFLIIDTSGNLNQNGTIQADGLRLDVTPTAETPSMTHTVIINISGTDYKFACKLA